MNDCEINRRLAEIVGFEWAELGGRYQYARLSHPEQGSMWSHEWSPLTDWSQLGPLMERFYVEVGCDVECAEGWDARARFRPHGPWSSGYSDPKRAIALAIIAAHEEE